uniref:Right handed beta helix domain-containing protein n=1 Tax=Amphimedon queenslandica TaxID=400682 RepID=A0A1X7UJE8_AMPQE
MQSVLVLLFLLLLLIQEFASNEIYISSNGSSVASCGSIHSPCLSLSDITQWENDTAVIIEGSIVLDCVIEIHSIHNLTFTSSSASSNKKEEAAVINCVCPSYNCGLIIEDCQDVTFKELNVSGCSMQHQMSGHCYRSGIIMNITTDMLLSNVSISNNIGTGLLLINAAGNITIEESVFSNNSIPYALQQNGLNGKAVHGGAGLVILISACEITAKNCSHVSASGNYNILGTLFHNNTVNLFKLSSRNWLFSYGGGLGILSVWNVQGNTFNIEGTNFINNAAFNGGGMVWHCQKFCYNNKVKLHRCLFTNNYLSMHDGGGAGMSTGIAQYHGNMSANNIVTVNETSFVNNTGYYASGVLVYCNAKEDDKFLKFYNYVHFIKSSWESNTGTVSPAVELRPNYRSYYYNTFTTKTTFEHCTFSNNTIERYYYPTEMPSYTFRKDVGVFVITKLTVHFKGNNTFSNNKGTALYIVSGSAFFKRGAFTVFENNTGTTGGAVRLVGYSNFEYNNDTMFVFTNNSASFVGGAISVSNTKSYISLSSYSCFLQYHNDDDKEYSYNYETNARFLFEHNWSSTGIANSIFLDTIKSCQYSCVTQSGEIPKPTELFINQSCIGIFEFDNSNNTIEIASGGSLFNINQSTLVSIIPGRMYSLPLTLLDDMDQNVTNITIFQPSLSNGSNIKVSPGFEFVADNKIQMTGKPGERSNLTLIVSGFQNIGASISIELASCPPGYIIDDDSSSCVCSASQNNKSLTYIGIVGCIENKGVAISGYWVGYILSNENEKPNQMNLYTCSCPFGFCHYSNIKGGNGKIKQDYNLAKVASRDEMDKAVCTLNRHGTMCSQCKEGYSVYFHSNTNKCGENHHCSIGFVFYLLSEILPITGLFFIIVYFDISLTTGLAYNFFFMAQLLDTMVVSVNGAVEFKPTIIRSIYTVLYSTLNLEFFNIDELSFCLWNGAGTLNMISMKYVSVIYAVLLILGFVYMFRYCTCGLKGKRCCKNIFSYSMVQGLTAFLVISYFQCSRISFMLLSRESPNGIGGRFYKNIVFWNGSLEYFSPQHLQYALPAIISLILFVIPFPLILTFDGLLLKVESKLAIRFAFIRRLMPWTAIHYKLKPLLDSFQGPFKDQYRFFAGLYFFYRFLILALLVIASSIHKFYFFLEVVLIICMMIQAMAQPFQEKSHNVCALLVFTNMALINAFTMRIYYLVSNYGYTAETITMQWIQMGLIYVPLVAAVLKVFWSRCCKIQRYSPANNDYEELLFNRSTDNAESH